MKHLRRSIELLEARIAPATFIVTSNAGTGPGTLDQALLDAIQSPGLDTITFNLAPGNTTITATAALLADSPVIIDGRTQPGYVNSPIVSIVGQPLSAANGLNFGQGSSGSAVHGLAISGFREAGIIVNDSGILVSGCTITQNQTGVVVIGNFATIGGVGESARNVISGNLGEGIYAAGVGDLTVMNTHIGLNRAGTTPEGNGTTGIFVVASGNVTIGGPDKNVIASNAGDGISLQGVYGAVTVFNNWIGMSSDGFVAPALQNTGVGVRGFGSANFFIGWNGVTGNPNYIANNAGGGIDLVTQDNFGGGSAVVSGNVIGSALSGSNLIAAPNGGTAAIIASGPGIRIGGSTPAEHNNISWATGTGIIPFYNVEISGNRFAAGSTNIIDVEGDGRTLNDVGDTDAVQNFPILAGAALTNGNPVVVGMLDSKPNTNYTLRLYAFVNPLYQAISDLGVTTDSSGHASFAIPTSALGGYTNVAMTAMDATTNNTSEMSPLAIIAPAAGFVFPSEEIQAEGNTGSTLFTFPVRLTAAAIGPVSMNISVSPNSTATPGVDFSFSPPVLNFSQGMVEQTVTVLINSDTDVEPAEYINFVLSNITGNAFILDTQKSIIIANDDTSLKISTDGKVATWRDVDGDMVTLKATKGILDPGDFSLISAGTFGGEVLTKFDVADDGPTAKGVGLAFSAKFDKTRNRGDGLINLGFLDSTGVDLGVVSLSGDLGHFIAGDSAANDGAIKSLAVGSIGMVNNQAEDSITTGKLGALTVRGDVFASRIFSDRGMTGVAKDGSIGAITIGGGLLGDSVRATLVQATGDIGAIKVRGSLINESTGEKGGILADGKIGAVTIGGSIRGVLGIEPTGIFAGSTLGKVTVGGDLHDTTILALGNVQPANAAAAVAIAGVAVKGRVYLSTIGAGRSIGGDLNPDASIGAIVITGDWVRSNVFAGVGAGADGMFGTADDAAFTPTVPAPNNPAIVSKIASVVVLGQIAGTQGELDSFGFVAQSIGKFGRGPAAYALKPNTVPNAAPLDLLVVSSTLDVFVREVL